LIKVEFIKTDMDLEQFDEVILLGSKLVIKAFKLAKRGWAILID